MPNDTLGFFVKEMDGFIAGFEESSKGAWTSLGQNRGSTSGTNQATKVPPKLQDEELRRVGLWCDCLAPAQAAR